MLRQCLPLTSSWSPQESIPPQLTPSPSIRIKPLTWHAHCALRSDLRHLFEPAPLSRRSKANGPRRVSQSQRNFTAPHKDTDTMPTGLVVKWVARRVARSAAKRGGRRLAKQVIKKALPVVAAAVATRLGPTAARHGVILRPA